MGREAGALRPSRDLTEIEIVTLFRARRRILCPAVRIVGVPNAAKRSQWAANQAKREGLATGFPDVLCFWRDRGIAAIEFKTTKGKLSDHQAEWLDWLTEIGIPCTVSRDADHALEFLRSCGAPFIGRLS